jgi:hypothetical protein
MFEHALTKAGGNGNVKPGGGTGGISRNMRDVMAVIAPKDLRSA